MCACCRRMSCRQNRIAVLIFHPSPRTPWSRKSVWPKGSATATNRCASRMGMGPYNPLRSKSGCNTFCIRCPMCCGWKQLRTAESNYVNHIAHTRLDLGALDVPGRSSLHNHRSIYFHNCKLPHSGFLGRSVGCDRPPAVHSCRAGDMMFSHSRKEASGRISHNVGSDGNYVQEVGKRVVLKADTHP